MKINNYLNRLGIVKIYALLLALAILSIILITLLFNFLFSVESADQTVEHYTKALQEQNFYQASQDLPNDLKEGWSETFSTYAEDSSALRSLYFFFWKQAKIDSTSASQVAENNGTVRIQFSSVDGEKILAEVRNLAESGRIDLSDSEVVRAAADQESQLYYYIIDHFEQFSNYTRKNEIILPTILEGSFTAKAWKLNVNDAYHDALSGNVMEAAEEIFASPLDIPKS